MSKKYLSAAFAYVGVIVGAGLASGQDLLQYFLAYGAIGLIGIAALGVLNVIFGAVALQLGSYYRSDNHDVVFEQIARPALRRIIDVVLVFSAFTMGFVMLAGAGANLEQQFGLPAWAGSALCAVLVVLTAFLNFDRIMNVIGVFTPIIMVAIAVLMIYSLVTPHASVAELDAAARNVTPALPNLVFSTLNYFALCVVGGIAMAFVLGGSILRIGEARRAGHIGGALIAPSISMLIAFGTSMCRLWRSRARFTQPLRLGTRSSFLRSSTTLLSPCSIRRHAASRGVRLLVCALSSSLLLRLAMRLPSWASRS